MMRFCVISTWFWILRNVEVHNCKKGSELPPGVHDFGGKRQVQQSMNRRVWNTPDLWSLLIKIRAWDTHIIVSHAPCDQTWPEGEPAKSGAAPPPSGLPSPAWNLDCPFPGMNRPKSIRLVVVNHDLILRWKRLPRSIRWSFDKHNFVFFPA